MSDAFRPLLAAAADGPLDPATARRAFTLLMSGEATPSQIGGFLMALRTRGETVAEITAAATVMREKAVPVQAPPGAMDIVGTGGDDSGSLNISTATALVVAGAGVPVAKHGNRALSSRSGTADALEALGVDVMAGAAAAEAALAEAGIGFLMAPVHHSAMRHVGPSRRELGTRTIFNILGPLTSPARVRRQLTGVFADRLRRPLAEALSLLGSERAWLVHGDGGLDEISISGPTRVTALEAGRLREFEIRPEAAGLAPHPPDAIAGGSPAANAARLSALLDGAADGFRDAVLLNAAAALVIAGRAKSLGEGAGLAAAAIDSGAARERLTRLAAITRRHRQAAGGDG